MFSGFHYYSINNLKLSWGLSLYSLKIKICQIQMSEGGLFKVRMSKQQSTTCPNIFRIWGVEFPNQGGSYEATSDPPLWAVTPMATLSEWKSKRSQKLSKKMSKCANFTITAAKSSKKQHMPSAANIIFFQLHQKRHGIKKHKTDILHPEHLVCWLNLRRSFWDPGDVLGDLFGEPLPWNDCSCQADRLQT